VTLYKSEIGLGQDYNTYIETKCKSPIFSPTETSANYYNITNNKRTCLNVEREQFFNFKNVSNAIKPS